MSEKHFYWDENDVEGGISFDKSFHIVHAHALIGSSVYDIDEGAKKKIDDIDECLNHQLDYIEVRTVFNNRIRIAHKDKGQEIVCSWLEKTNEQQTTPEKDKDRA